MTPTQILTASLETIVDNEGAEEFYSKISTAPNQREMIEVQDSAHQLMQEPNGKKFEYYKLTFKFMSKMLESAPNWKCPKIFEMGRHPQAKKAPFKRFLALAAVSFYLAVMILIWVISKLNKGRAGWGRLLVWPVLLKQLVSAKALRSS